MQEQLPRHEGHEEINASRPSCLRGDNLLIFLYFLFQALG